MKNLQSMFYTLVMVLGLTSVSNAASLSGLYFEVGSSAAGVELDGSHTDDDSDVSKGTVGKTAVIAHYGLGYMTPRSSVVGLDFGYIVTPGEAKINATSDDSNTDVSFEVADGDEYYIAPMINITEDASIYLKYGVSKADVNVTGDIKQPGDLEGTTVALGTVMSWGSNLYIRTEAGMIDYDTISATGKGTTGGIGTDVSVSASPEIAYGKIAIGYKF
tara:strand:- start:635 stop:1288 length:654 start_codon:yes stop_codon:yes gene_type:complete